MSSKRSQWCEFSKEERKYIKKRDKEQCYLCGAKGGLQVMHIFVSRAQGGKGERRNGVLGCVQCHTTLDNPIGVEQNALSRDYLCRCKEYLREVEHIDISERELCEQLKYHKTATPMAQAPKMRAHARCKDCAACVPNKRTNSTIPSYYCKRYHCLVRSTAEACKNAELK